MRILESFCKNVCVCQRTEISSTGVDAIEGYSGGGSGGDHKNMLCVLVLPRDVSDPAWWHAGLLGHQG